MLKCVTAACLAATCALIAQPAAAQVWPHHASSACGCEQGCGTGGYSEAAYRRAEFRAHYDLIKQHADLIADRNDAWPKPFQCYDRQAYHGIFASNIQAGWVNECTLTHEHFDPNTQTLNSSGRSKVAAVMLNLPQPAREIFVFNDGDTQLLLSRLEAVQAEVAAHFAHLSAPRLASTTRLPQGMSGSLVADVQEKFIKAQPVPAVPAASQGGVADQ